MRHTAGSMPAEPPAPRRGTADQRRRGASGRRGSPLMAALALVAAVAVLGGSCSAVGPSESVGGPAGRVDGGADGFDGASSTTTTAAPATTAAPTTTLPPTTTTTAPPPVPPAPAPVTPAPVTPLAAGATGPAVSQLQQRLSEMGYWLPGIDGRYSSSTSHAVTAFQKANNLPRTGKADPATLAAMATAPRPTALRPVPGRSLEVDLGRQILLVVNGGQVDVVLDISSGKRSTPTPTGDYQIQRQIDGLRISKLGELWRPKYFTGGYALHGSPSVPTSPASHGCVRLTNAEIDWLWASGVAPVGTPLFVY